MLKIALEVSQMCIIDSVIRGRNMAKRNHALDQPILESARKIFLEKGFEHTALKEICEDAGVTTGAVYKRYKDKEELFAAVVEKSVQEMNRVVEEKSDIDPANLSDEELISEWEMKEDNMMWWFEYLYERREDFVLLISRAETTRYANFQHDWVEKMSDTTYSHYEEMCRRNIIPEKMDRKELHILLTSFWTMIYEPFIHGYTMEEIKNHCRIMCRIFDWYKAMGIQKK